MRKRTRRELDQMKKEITDLHYALWEISNAAGLARLPDKPPEKGRYVSANSPEWKKHVEEMKAQQKTLAKLAQIQVQAHSSRYSPNSMGGLFNF